MTKQNPVINPVIRQREEDFYSSYGWCLNPLQKVNDLILHLEEELQRSMTTLEDWELDECRINLYLLVCAITCTLDDYLVWRPLVISPVGDIFPFLRPFLGLMQGAVNLPYLFRASSGMRTAHRWRIRWTACVEEICQLLLGVKNSVSTDTLRVRSEIEKLRTSPLPADLLKRRMKINEGFRCQDLTHHDILTMVDRYLGSHPDVTSRIIVVGPRTAGAYFAPLVKVYLNAKGFNNVSWLTIRPKLRTTQREFRALRNLLVPGAHVILTDDYSNTGLTFRLLQNVLRMHGVPPERITILAPLHPARQDVSLSLHPKTDVIALHHNDLYKEGILNPRSAERIFRNYFITNTCTAVSMKEDPEIERMNVQETEHYKDGFHVRLKRVYKVRFDFKNGESETRTIIGKSVGWGWLGYHAYLAGIRLHEYVPNTIGLSNGILYTEWVEGRHGIDRDTAKRALVPMSLYIARRTEKLALSEDPRFARPDIGWGWLEILSILRRAYGNYPGYLKHNALLRSLKAHVSPLPTLIDGQMGPEEWVKTEQRLVKIDFEHHNFGAPQLDVVDPAFDLGAVCFEFRYSDEEESSLLRSYSDASGDKTILDRIVLYKLLYAYDAKRRALEGLQRKHTRITPEDWNQRYQWSWNYLVFTMNRLCSGMMERPKSEQPMNQLFFLDLDGVFDAEYLGFPHTTPSGIAALSFLRSNGFSVIPNTGRSIQHVRDYCASYGFSGGIAEYGSVLFDAIQKTEVPLIGGEVEDQLRICRDALHNIPGVYTDSGYRYSVRAYRYNDRRTMGLEKQEADDLIKKYGLGKLSFIRRSDDTYFVGRETGKGRGIEQFKDYFHCQPETVVAMGDSDEDVSMLETAERGFAPANCSQGIRKLAGQNKCRIVTQTRQRGLLKVAELVGHQHRSGFGQQVDMERQLSVRALIYRLTGIAEQSRFRKLVSLLHPYSL